MSFKFGNKQIGNNLATYQGLKVFRMCVVLLLLMCKKFYTWKFILENHPCEDWWFGGEILTMIIAVMFFKDMQFNDDLKYVG